MANLKATLKFIQFFFWCALLIIPQAIILLFSHGKAAYLIPLFWHKMMCRIFNLEVVIEGTPITDGQIVFVSNHISYLDIIVIASTLPASFVAKKEVASWPVFGLLAKLQQCVFIDRARHRINDGQNSLQKKLNSGNSLIFFPEGTSSDGTVILPFKSSLFSVAITLKSIIQPFTIELIETNGKKITTEKDRDRYAWHGDMTLAPHFWSFAKSSGAKVKLHFHAPIQVKDDDNRKYLAKTCYEKVTSPLLHKGA